jgi:spore coat polysaccharide biosynthesis protein SpsF
MKRGAVIQARLDSVRFPGKALAPLAGRPILEHVITRTRRITRADEIVLATSDRAVDDPIAALGREAGIPVYRGSLGDVVERTLGCAIAHGFDVVARICGDSPFLSPELFDRALDLQEETDADLVSNTLVRTFPKGWSVEVFPRRTLEQIIAATADASHRGELMMSFIYERPDQFRIASFRAEGADLGQASVAIDTPEDLVRAEALVARLGGDPLAIPDATLLAQIAAAAGVR